MQKNNKINWLKIKAIVYITSNGRYLELLIQTSSL